MNRLLVPALFAAAFAAPASAQYYYDPYNAQPADRQLPGYQDDEQWSGGSSVRSDDMRPGYAQPAPPAPPGTNGGYRDNGNDAAYARGDDGYGYADPNAGYGARPPRAAPPAARSPYAERIARWRARADACEAGDRRACEGPE